MLRVRRPEPLVNLNRPTSPIPLNEKNARWVDVVDDGVRQTVERTDDKRLVAGGLQDCQRSVSVTGDAPHHDIGDLSRC